MAFLSFENPKVAQKLINEKSPSYEKVHMIDDRRCFLAKPNAGGTILNIGQRETESGYIPDPAIHQI